MKTTVFSPWCALHAILVICYSASPHGIEAEHCQDHSECQTSLGLTCQRLYQDCDVGQCMCDPYRQRMVSGRCVTVRRGNEACSPSDVCISSDMTCIGGTCRCIDGVLTPDTQYCLANNQKLVGSRCNPAIDTCLQRTGTGYSRADTTCSPTQRFCKCVDGYKQDGISCVRWKILEVGCLRTVNCEGGAICSDRRCVCPSGYVVSAGRTKCARQGAVKDVPIGENCDEFNEQTYCANGLVCLKCSKYSEYKCMKFLLTSGYNSFISGGTSLVSVSRVSLTLLCPLVLTLLALLHRVR